MVDPRGVGGKRDLQAYAWPSARVEQAFRPAFSGAIY